MGQSLESIKQAISQGREKSVDPTAFDGYWKDDVLVKLAAQKGVVFEINLSPVIALPATQRPKSLRELKAFLAKCAKHGAKVRISAQTANPLEAKTPRELQAIATEILGMDAPRARAAVSPGE